MHTKNKAAVWSAPKAARSRSGWLQGIVGSVGFSALVAGCGGTTHDHGSCANETRAEPYVAGQEKVGKQGALSVQLIESQPGPPQKGDNTWTLAVKTSAGTPVAGATVNVTPFMPDHGHGSPIKAITSELSTPAGAGQYRVTPINLFMPGLWQITVAVQTGSGTSDSAVFPFCIDG